MPGDSAPSKRASCRDSLAAPCDARSGRGAGSRPAIVSGRERRHGADLLFGGRSSIMAQAADQLIL